MEKPQHRENLSKDELKKNQQEKKKMDRRDFLKIAGVGLAGLAVGGAAGYLAKPPQVITQPMNTTITQTVGQTATPTLTVDEAYAVMAADMATLGSTVNDVAKQANIKWDQYSGTNIRMITLAESDYQHSLFVGSLAQQFKALTGIDVSVEFYDSPEMLQKILTDFESKAGVYDVVGIQDYGTMSQYVDKLNGIVPLDTFLNNSQLTDLNWFDLDDFYPALLAGSQLNGKQYALADEWESTWCYYRKDIFDKYGVTKLPDTFDDLAAAAEQCNHPPTIYGIASRGLPSIGENIFTFCSFLFGYGADWLGPDWKPAFNSDAGVAALDMYATLLSQYGPPGIASWGWEDERLFSFQGHAAINCPASYWRSMSYWSKAIGLVAPQVLGNMWMIPIQKGPAGYRVSPLFLHQHSISAFSKHQEAAWLWLQYIHSKPVMTYDCYVDLAWTRKSSWQTVPSVAGLTSLLDSFNKYIPVVSQTTYNYAFSVPIPEWPDIGGSIAFAVSSAIAGQKTAKQAFDDAATEVEATMDKAGYYAPGVAPYTHPPPPQVTVQY